VPRRHACAAGPRARAAARRRRRAREAQPAARSTPAPRAHLVCDDHGDAVALCHRLEHARLPAQQLAARSQRGSAVGRRRRRRRRTATSGCTACTACAARTAELGGAQQRCDAVQDDELDVTLRHLCVCVCARRV
jgi:hypothetical protein